MSQSVAVSAIQCLPGQPPKSGGCEYSFLSSDRRERRIDRMGTVLLDAVSDVLAQSQWTPDDQLAVLVNSYAGPMDTVVRCLEIIRDEGVVSLSPIHFSNSVANAQAGHCAIRFVCRGPSMTTMGSSPLYLGALWLNLHRASRALVIDMGEFDPLGISLGTEQLSDPGLRICESLSVMAISNTPSDSTQVFILAAKSALRGTDLSLDPLGDALDQIGLSSQNLSRVWVLDARNHRYEIPDWRGSRVYNLSFPPGIYWYGGWEARALTSILAYHTNGSWLDGLLVHLPNGQSTAYIIASDACQEVMS
ncbi:MAG: hypothetical protein M1499_08690 [Firmicutes bacterium]|nr:hypothetical protein [Bacillota bacterium]